MNEVKFSKDCKEPMLRGIKTLYNAVSVTMGPLGRNVIIKRGAGDPQITKDGVTVAGAVYVNSIDEQIGIDICRNAAHLTNMEAGDGTTAATVLAYELFKQNISNNDNINHIKIGIDKACDKVCEKLKQMAIKDFDPYNIAYISSNGDIQVSKLISEAFEQVGTSGVVRVKRGEETKLTREEGLRMKSGWASPYFVTDHSTGKSTYEDANILLVDGDIEKIDDLVPYFNLCGEQKKPFVIIANDFGGEVMGILVSNRQKKSHPFLAIKSPHLGTQRTNFLEDLAAMTGATVISENKGTIARLGLSGSNPNTIQKSTERSIGSLKKIIAGKTESIILFDKNEEYIENLKSLYKETKDEVINNRVASLNNGIAVIEVSSGSQVEFEERIDRTEDAVNATRVALEEGIVAGGGIALIKARESINDLQLEGDYKKGAKMLYDILDAPAKKILSNANIEYKKLDYPIGINAATSEIVDMIEGGIIDPVKVITKALRNAVSVSSTLLTTEAMVIFNPEK
jgi:chaperonin GroEL